MPRYKVAPLRTRSGEVRMGLRHADSGQFAEEEAAGQAPVDASAFDDPEPSLADEAADLGARIAALVASGATPAEWAEQEAAIRRLGRRIAERAEEISGVDPEAFATEASAARQEAARRIAEITAAKQAGFDRVRERQDEIVADADAGRIGHEESIRLQTELVEGWRAEHERLQDEHRALWARYQDGSGDEAARALALAAGYSEALAEVRKMGGELVGFHARSNRKAVAVFREAAQVYPADWIEASEDRGPMMARMQKSRAHYSEGHLLKTTERRTIPMHTSSGRDVVDSPDAEYEPGHGPRPYGGFGREAGTCWAPHPDQPGRFRLVMAEAPREIRLQGLVYRDQGEPKGKGWVFQRQDDDGYGFWYRPETQEIEVEAEQVPEIKTSPDGSRRIAIHELAHRMEYAVPGIAKLERAFLDRRWHEAGVAGDPPKPLFPGSDEATRDAGFADPYVGKLYEHDRRMGAAPTEVMSMGMEALFATSRGCLLGARGAKADHDHRAFVLGVLAAVGRRAQ